MVVNEGYDFNVEFQYFICFSFLTDGVKNLLIWSTIRPFRRDIGTIRRIFPLKTSDCGYWLEANKTNRQRMVPLKRNWCFLWSHVEDEVCSRHFQIYRDYFQLMCKVYIYGSTSYIAATFRFIKIFS